MAQQLLLSFQGSGLHLQGHNQCHFLTENDENLLLNECK